MQTPGVRYRLGGWLPDQPGENIAESVTDNGDGTGIHTVYAENGTVISTEPCQVPAADSASAVLAAVATARAEVAGYAQSNGTRQAVEALAAAVETLVQGATP